MIALSDQRRCGLPSNPYFSIDDLQIVCDLDSLTSYLPLAIWNCPSNGVVFNPLIHSPTMSFFNALFRSTRQCFFCINICEYFSSWTPSLTLQISSIDSFWLIMINYCFVDLFLYCIWGAGECVSALDIERGENEWWWWGWSFIVLDWKFSQVFGEGSAGEEVQEGPEEAQIWCCETEETIKRKDEEDRKKTWRNQRNNFL